MFPCFPPSICYEMMRPDAMILVFSMLSFKPTFSLSCFTFIKRLFSYSSLSAIRMLSSAYLRLLIFLLKILIPSGASSSPAFRIVYAAQNLSKWGDNMPDKDAKDTIQRRLQHGTKEDSSQAAEPYLSVCSPGVRASDS